MRLVLGVSTVLGVLGVIAAFGLFYLGERVLHLDRAHIQTMMYLKLSVAGHLTIFLTRTRGPFWSIRPARILWVAVLGTQLLATCIAIFGFGLVTPLAWYWALLVWGWALAWFLLNDRAKLLTYKVLDSAGVGSKPLAQAEPKPDQKEPPMDATAAGKAGPKTSPRAEPASDGKAQPQQATEAGKADDKPSAQAEPELDEKAQPRHTSEPDKADDKPSPKIAPAAEPAATAAAQHHKASPSSDSRPSHDPSKSNGVDNAKVATLMDTKLGEVFLAAVLKDPVGAGHFIAQAIDDAESSEAVARSPADKDALPPAPVPEAAE